MKKIIKGAIFNVSVLNNFSQQKLKLCTLNHISEKNFLTHVFKTVIPKILDKLQGIYRL